MFCSSVFFCEKKNAPTVRERTLEYCWGGFSLTERTEFTELFGALFRYHRTPSAYRYHRAFRLKKGVGCWVLDVDDKLTLAVRFCEIG